MKIDILFNNGITEAILVPQEDFTQEMKEGIIRLTEAVFNKSQDAGYIALTIGQETHIIKLSDVSRLRLIEGDTQ